MLRFNKLGKKEIALLGAASLFVISLVIVTLAKWEPGAYRPIAIPREEHQQMRNHLVAAEQAFTENLRADAGPFTYHIYQEDLNRWLAMREDIYPAADEWLPDGLSAPMIVFEDDSVTLMGRYTGGLGSALLSIQLSLGIENGAIVLRVVGLRCGLLGVPRTFVRGLAAPIERESGDTWPGSPAMSGDLIEGLRLNAEAWWKNGGIAYRVRSVQVVKGRLDLNVEPLGPRVQTRTKDHASASLSD